MQNNYNKQLHVGIDVGSTTIKAVVMNNNNHILWKDYRRHNARQSDVVKSFMIQIEKEFNGTPLKMYITGSGGRSMASALNANYIQEVVSVTHAVETLYPDTGSVVELGGQDAKVIVWKKDHTGKKSAKTYMNDKCAGGTGATLDKICAKIGLDMEEVAGISLEDKTIHHVAAKCGVFAETDIVGLLKTGVRQDEIAVSLCAAIVKQNLEVLVRGNILRDRVLLLGGPHRYLNLLADLWRMYIPKTWELHEWTPTDLPIEELIRVPDDSEFFAAIGSVLFGTATEKMMAHLNDKNNINTYIYPGIKPLEEYISNGRLERMMSYGAIRDGLVKNEEELEEFKKQYTIPPFQNRQYNAGENVSAYLGVDGGSTSSKIALIDEEGDLIYKGYLLSGGNPIADVKKLLEEMYNWSKENKINLNISASGVTGYASSILSTGFSFDTSIIETVAHMKSSVASYGEIDVICDVGGQDIKVLFMKNGSVVDFKLNTQCSAGNGYFLQAIADQFNIPIEEYADYALKAEKAPSFNYGCAVFMEQDRVNFQQLGWSMESIMAGLALVLPLNIWNYVVQEVNIAKRGKRFILQGGTQKNLAAVKAQVDFIKERVPDAEVHVHKYAEISGAMGAAIEAKERIKDKVSTFIGLENSLELTFHNRCDQSTRCNFCKNLCQRTFVDIFLHGKKKVHFITGYSCEKGMANSVEEMKKNTVEKKEALEKCPNLVTLSNKYLFENEEPIVMSIDSSDNMKISLRNEMVVGIPKLLNQYIYSPFFETYFRSLGIKKIIYSDYTSPKLWEDGNKWGSIDPCFPAKVAPAHIYNLLKKKEVTHICFPIVTHIDTHIENTLGSNTCVIQAGTPEVVHSVFTMYNDFFVKNNKEYWKPFVRLSNQKETAGELFEYFEKKLNLSREENEMAVSQGFLAMERYLSKLRAEGANVISDLVENDRIGILVLGKPYHHDPGLNHGIIEEFQKLGYPILCMESLPVMDDFLMPLFQQDLDEKRCQSPFDIKDVWMRNFNKDSNQKIWAAKVAARHPNLAIVDLSSFKCGHDAPIYSYLDNILDTSMTPFFVFHDIDQNKPEGSIKIRLKTIDYFLKIEEEKLIRRIKLEQKTVRRGQNPYAQPKNKAGKTMEGVSNSNVV